MKTMISISISLVMTAFLLSGVQVLHDVAFAIAVFSAALACILMPFIFFCDAGAFRKNLPGLYIKLPFTALFWFALAYTNHPYLLAINIVALGVYLLAAALRINEEGAK